MKYIIKQHRFYKIKKEYLTYIRAEQAELDHKGQIKYAEEKGRKEGKLEIAINLKKEGFSLESIAKTTGIPLSKVKKL